MSRQPSTNHTQKSQKNQHTYYPIETNITDNQGNQSANKNITNGGLKYEKSKEKELDELRRLNMQLQQRECIYLQKLIKLQEGLENQYFQLVKMQDLYSDLFASYKQKQIQISELQIKYRQNQRKRQLQKSNNPDLEKFKNKNEERIDQITINRSQYESFQKQDQQTIRTKIVDEIQNQWRQKQQEWNNRQNELTIYIQELNQKILSIQLNTDRITNQLSYLKIKDSKIQSSKVSLSDKAMEEMQQLRAAIEVEKQNRLKFQYQNAFLKNRNKDLEKHRDDLQRILTYKQQQIIRLRQQKIKMHRLSSQKLMQKSAVKSSRRSPLKGIQSVIENEAKGDQNTDQSSNAQIYSTQPNLNQYFSFSKDKNQSSVDSQLPSFPAELDIDEILSRHRK